MIYINDVAHKFCTVIFSVKSLSASMFVRITSILNLILISSVMDESEFNNEIIGAIPFRSEFQGTYSKCFRFIGIFAYVKIRGALNHKQRFVVLEIFEIP